jgi:hypothetical protein
VPRGKSPEAPPAFQTKKKTRKQTMPTNLSGEPENKTEEEEERVCVRERYIER